MFKAGILRRFQFRNVIYVLKAVNCGKKACKRCPHGPYWYALIHIGRTKPAVRYIGKELHGDVKDYYENTYILTAEEHRL